MYEVQKLTGAIAVTSKAVFNLPCRAALLQRACIRVLGIVAAHLCLVALVMYEVQKLTGAIAVTSKAVFNLPCRAALLQRACTGS
jgi:predicted RNase H-like nuclease